MNKSFFLCGWLLGFCLSSSLAQAFNEEGGEEASLLPVESVNPPPDVRIGQSPWEFTYLGFLSRAGKVGDTHFTDAAGSDRYSAYATDFDTESHVKLSYIFKNQDRLTLNQRFYYSQVVNQSNWLNGGEVPYVGLTRLEYQHNLNVGQNSNLILRGILPSSYDYYYNQNIVAGLAGIGNLNWQLSPKVNLGTTHYVGAMVYGGNPRSLSPWQIESIKNAYTNDLTAAQGATYLNNTGPQRDNVTFDNRINFTYNFSDRLSFVQILGYAFGMKDISNNFSNFSRVTAEWEIYPELDYQLTKSVGLAVGAFQVAADMPGSSDLITGSTFYYDGHNFELLRPEETTYYLLVSYVY